MGINAISGSPESGYQYKLKDSIDAGVWEEIEKSIINSLAGFGYQIPREIFGPRENGMHMIAYGRVYDKEDKALGAPEKYFSLPYFGQVYVTYYFANEAEVIPCKISIEPGSGWETESNKYDRTFLAMEVIEKNLLSYIELSLCKVIYKCLKGVKGFDVWVDVP
jgi:hypothetical protein